jgi:hypothetical protein
MFFTISINIIHINLVEANGFTGEKSMNLAIILFHTTKTILDV